MAPEGSYHRSEPEAVQARDLALCVRSSRGMANTHGWDKRLWNYLRLIRYSRRVTNAGINRLFMGLPKGGSPSHGTIHLTENRVPTLTDTF